MDEIAITNFITTTFPGVEVVAASGDSFFFFNPDRTIPADHKFPFLTLVTSDNYDQASNLNRPGVFRLNIGVSKETYRSMFGPSPSPPGASGVVEMQYDFTALDQILPHPVYAPQFWVCVLNPSDETFEKKVQPLLAEAYELAAGRYAKRTGRGSM